MNRRLLMEPKLSTRYRKKQIEYIKELPIIISWDDNAIIHGGIDHTKPLDEHTVTNLLNMRSLSPDGGYNRPLWFETRNTKPRIFFGHTVLSEPLETPYAVGLDTGCVHGKQLTAYNYTESKFETYNVPTTHVSRDADSIVNPNQ